MPGGYFSADRGGATLKGVGASPSFVSDNARDGALARRLLRRMPQLDGATIRLERRPGLREHGREVHAGSFLRERRIALNCTRAEFPRIFVHEVFHFVWLRAGNARRRSYGDVVLLEWSGGIGGELGWSAEWRKEQLGERDVNKRSRRWREYCCESFCDTAAWLFSGTCGHGEFTLPAASRRRRRQWFSESLGGPVLSI